VSGDTVYVQLADGTTVKVVASGSTTIRVSTQGALSDLTAGSTVVVQGTASSDGSTITANTITEGGLGGFPGRFGNGPGAPSASPSG
jgi:uridine phosphorylase